jgi:hypothetical protein
MSASQTLQRIWRTILSPRIRSRRPQNAAIQLQAVDLKARVSAPLVLRFREANCDGFLECRA